MKPLMLIATLVALANGRPEAGYSYPRPGGGSIGILSGGHGHGDLGGLNLGGHGDGGFVFGDSGFQQGGGHFATGGGHGIGGGIISSGGPSFTGGHGIISSGGPSFSGGHGIISSGGPSFSGGHGIISSGGPSFSGGHGIISSGGPSFSGGHGIISSGGPSFGGGSFIGNGLGSGGFVPSGGVTVQKHIYVHVPPPEPEEFRPQRPIAVGQAQKHYKIIFIKAPTSATPTAQTIPLQSQSEEKTLVYVLVKKPDEPADITIPTPAATVPSKPEVYFIRYKTQKDNAGGAISGGSLGGDISGGLSGGSAISSGGIISGGPSFISGGDSHGHGVIGGGDIGSVAHGPAVISGGGPVISGDIGSISHGISGGDINLGTNTISSSSHGISSNYGPPGHTSGGPY